MRILVMLSRVQGLAAWVIMILENQMQTDIETWLAPGFLGGTCVMLRPERPFLRHFW